MTDITDARVETAAALRDLVQAFAGHDADDGTLERVAREARSLAAEITAAPRRTRTIPTFAQTESVPPPVGEPRPQAMSDRSMRPFRTASRAVLVFVVLALAGTAWPAAAAAGGDAGPCEYLKRSEVERAIGRDVRVGEPPTGVGGVCSFPVRGAPADVVNLWVLEGDDARIGFESGETIGGDDVVRLRGLGDDAIYLGDPLNTAYVLDDDTLVYLQYFLLSGDDSPRSVRRAVVALTKKALNRT